MSAKDIERLRIDNFYPIALVMAVRASYLAIEQVIEEVCTRFSIANIDALILLSMSQVSHGQTVAMLAKALDVSSDDAGAAVDELLTQGAIEVLRVGGFDTFPATYRVVWPPSELEVALYGALIDGAHIHRAWNMAIEARNCLGILAKVIRYTKEYLKL